MYNRDDVLKDLRNHVIETTFGKQNIRCTLKQDLLPKSYTQDLNEQKKEKEFHEKNKNYIAAWDVQNSIWCYINLDSVQYMQIIDGYWVIIF